MNSRQCVGALAIGLWLSTLSHADCNPQWAGLASSETWSPVAAQSMHVADLGDGPRLFTGAHQVGVHAWDGSVWTPLGLGGGNTHIRALAASDLGNGMRLFAARKDSGTYGTSVWQRTPTSWSIIVSNFWVPGGPYGPGQWHLGLPEIGDVRGLAVYEPPNAASGMGGPALYLGGSRGASATTRLYRYTPATGVQPVPGVFSGSNPGGSFGVTKPAVLHLVVYERGDGSGPALYAAGNFTHVDGVESHNIARFDGASWSPVGDLTHAPPPETRMFIAELDSGPILVVGDRYWDGQSFTLLGRGTGLTHLFALNDGPARGLYSVSGEVTERWTGEGWEAVGPGLTSGFEFGSVSINVAETSYVANTPRAFISGFVEAVGDDAVTGWSTWGCGETNVPGDLNGDSVVDVSDLLILLAAWGPCPSGEPCPADLNGDGVVDVTDLLVLLANWG